jgi:predicted glycogen debranching enzyme
MQVKGEPVYASADCPLWFIWALQQVEAYDPKLDIWKKYEKVIKSILNSFREGTTGMIHMMDNGLIHAEREGTPLTWMDSVVDGLPVTPRYGSPVEVNALWYNAVCQSLEWAKNRDRRFEQAWSDLPELIQNSFKDAFWIAESGYLADCIHEQERDISVRPNQVLAVSMPFSPLETEMKKSVLDILEGELLTPRGLRSLSPKNELYKGVYEGDQGMRDRAYHQGTVWPWLLEHFVRGYLDVHKRSGLHRIKTLYDGFEEELSNRGIGSISGVYDGNPPHHPGGAVSKANSVAAILRIGEMIESFN